MSGRTTIVFRADAVFDVMLGVVMLALPWLPRVFSELGLPNPTPEVFTQLGSGPLIGYAYLLWISPDNDSIALEIGWVVGVINVAGAFLILWWILRLGLSRTGFVVLCFASALLVVFAIGEISFVVATKQNCGADES